MSKSTVLILFGGKSTEYEVSLISASSILSNIDREKYNVITVGITKGGDWYLYNGDIPSIKDGSWCSDTMKLNRAALSPSPSDAGLYVFGGDGKAKLIHIDVIFPVMHGANAEDGTLQGLMQLSGIPFVGCGCATSAIGMDKGYTKLILQNYDIPQAKCGIFNKFRMAQNIDGVVDVCERIRPYPLFVKPANAGSSVGASKVNNREELIAALWLAADHDKKIIVEEYITGKEVEVAVMGSGDYIASTCGQINPGSDFYDYDAKYGSDSNSSAIIPADISEDTAEAVRELATRICRVLGVTGLSRVDFFVYEENGVEQIIFNEINTLPGFTEISMYPKLFMHDGMTYSGIIDALIDLATKEA